MTPSSRPRLLDRITHLLETFSPTEKILLYGFIVLLILSALAGLYHLNQTFFVEVPTSGGALSEGILGTPRFINPLLALSDADQDLTTLIYSGLLRATPEGTLETDLAESYTISEDGRTYSFILKNGIHFHDGKPVTADDVIFTIERAQDPALKSPRRANWEGVTVEKVSDREIHFILSSPYGPFLENATLGILPKHLWENISSEQFPFSQLNIEPIGSGPYKLQNLSRNDGGLPEAYRLKAFDGYALGKPYIRELSLILYESEDELLVAYGEGDVDTLSSISPDRLDEIDTHASQIIRTPLPRIFGIFFNQNVAPVFVHESVRKALDIAAPRYTIVEEVLKSYGSPADGPIPPGLTLIPHDEVPRENVEGARTILTQGGWSQDEAGIWKKTTKGSTETLSFSIATGNTPELKHVAEILKREYEALGVIVELKFFDIGDLNQNVIRPRKYDALLFGEIVGRELDLFPFWHSSQRNDPGLNVALYASIAGDRLLEEARKTSDEQTKLEILQEFQQEVHDSTPAVFLYTPDFIYVTPHDLKGVNLGPLSHSGERFLGINRWYLKTERVWPFLTSFTNLTINHFLN